MFAGCSSSENNGETAVATRIEGGQTQIAIENSEPDTSMDNEYGFTYNGYKIYPGMQASEALAILGDDYDQREDASCAGQGLDHVYIFKGGSFQVVSHPMDDTSGECKVMYVMLNDDTVATPEGVYIGNTVDQVKAAYGDPDADKSTDSILIYTKGTSFIQFEINESNVVTSIVYFSTDLA